MYFVNLRIFLFSFFRSGVICLWFYVLLLKINERKQTLVWVLFVVILIIYIYIYIYTQLRYVNELIVL